MLNFLTESSKDFKETETIGSFSMGQDKNSFDSLYESARDELMMGSIDPMVDINLMLKQPALMESFKDTLLSQLKEDCAEFDPKADSSRYSSLYEQTSALFD